MKMAVYALKPCACPTCGNQFVPSTYAQTHCSSECWLDRPIPGMVKIYFRHVESQNIRGGAKFS